jgi:cholesterol transport system auxiliary component
VKLLPPLMLLLSLALAGCGSLFKNQTAPPTIYWLSAAQPSGAAALPADPADPAGVPLADLAVLKPRARAGLDTDRVAALYPDRRLEYFADVRWSGPLDEVLQDLAVQTLHSHPGMRNVSTDISAFPSAYWLEIEVVDFQAEYGAPETAPTVHVHLLARIGNSATRHILGRFEPDVREASTGNRMSAIIDAYNRAAGKALNEIAAGAGAALNKEPHH